MARKLKFQSPTGMHDILQEEQKYFRKISDTAEEIAAFYGFKRVDTPLLEQSDLYVKGTGLDTDIVQKQMFNLRTKGGDLLTLRPEFTPGVVRAYIENGMANLPQPIKLYSSGPVFRYEHPQAGRLRQFHQLNLEILGDESPAADSQIIQIFYSVLTELKIKNIVVQINSIGDSACRPYYKKILVSYFRTRESALCPDCKRRLRENPLRILDCKEEKCQRIVLGAPQIIDHLCEPCHKHFKEVLEFLDEMQLPYQLNSYLVRGLDYYTKTVFEFTEDSPEGKQLGALAAGGRYDSLVKILGGRDTPASGGAAGIERIIEIMKTKELPLKKEIFPQVFLTQLGLSAKRKSLKLMEEFRKEAIPVAESLGRDSLRAQLRTADKIGAVFALILGQQEVLAGTVIIRDMVSGKQETVKIEKVVGEIKKKISHR